MKRLFKSFVLALAAMMAAVCLFAACDSGSGNGGANAATDIAITGAPADLQLEVGETLTLGYTLTPAGAEGSVVWSSSDTSKATVSNAGAVTGVAAGPVVITATVSGTDISDTLALMVAEPYVPNPVTAIAISAEGLTEGNLTMKRGETVALTVASTPENCDAYTLNWTYSTVGNEVEVVRTPSANIYNLVANGYGENITVTATVAGNDSVKASFTVTVAGDVDDNEGIMTETFARGSINANGVYYTDPAKTPAQATTGQIYEGAFFDAGTRSTSSSPVGQSLDLRDGALKFEIPDNENYYKIIFHYNGELDPNESYIVRIPVTAESVSDSANGLNYRFIYGYYDKISDDDFGYAYNHPATKNSEHNYSSSAAGGSTIFFGFSEVGETKYLDIRVSDDWNGEVYVCSNKNNSVGASGSMTLSFDNIQIIRESALTFADNVESFDGEDVKTEGHTVTTDMLTAVTAGDAIAVNNSERDAGIPGLDADGRLSAGNQLVVTTGRIYSRTARPSGRDDVTQLALTFNDIDETKAYEIVLPLSAYISPGFVKEGVTAADLNMVVFGSSACDIDSELYSGNPFANDKQPAVLRIYIPANSDWSGSVYIRLYCAKFNTLDENDYNKVIMIFDNITLSEMTAAIPSVTITGAPDGEIGADGAQLDYSLVGAETANVAWATSDANVLTVDNTGKVTAIANGTAIVTVTAEVNGVYFSDSVEITVKIQPADIEITGAPESGELVLNGTLQLGANILPAGAEGVVEWSCTNGTGSATVSATGLVTATGAGTVTVTATVAGTEIKDELELTITAQTNPVTEITVTADGLEDGAMTLQRSESVKLTITATPEGCDPYFLDWSVNEEGEGVVEIAEADGVYTLRAEKQGTVTVTVTVRGTQISTSFTVTVEGDPDYVDGIMTETFSRGEVDDDATYYTNADKSESTTGTIYYGAFFNVGARVGTSGENSVGSVSLADGALQWTVYNPAQYERITFYYTGNIEEGESYIVRIPVTAVSATETAIGTKLNYGYYTLLSGEKVLSYDHTASAAPALTMKYKTGSLSNADAVVQFSAAEETQYVYFRVGSDWNGEVWIACAGGQNAGITGRLTLAFDNIQVFKTSELVYGSNTETFENVTDNGLSVDGSVLTAVTNNGDQLNAAALAARDLGPNTESMPSTGNTLFWTSGRVYSESNNPTGTNTKLLLNFKNTDPSKAYEIEIPVQALIAQTWEETDETFTLADLDVAVYKADSNEAADLLERGNLFSFDGAGTVLKLSIPVDAEWKGTICFRIYCAKFGDGVQNNCAKINMYFDNIAISEVAEEA